jgi:hypothetical protein
MRKNDSHRTTPASTDQQHAGEHIRRIFADAAARAAAEIDEDNDLRCERLGLPEGFPIDAAEEVLGWFVHLAATVAEESDEVAAVGKARFVLSRWALGDRGAIDLITEVDLLVLTSLLVASLERKVGVPGLSEMVGASIDALGIESVPSRWRRPRVRRPSRGPRLARPPRCVP